MQGRPFVRNGITLLSGIDPQGRADRTADAIAVNDKTLYFCPSPLYGYGLARLLSRLEAAPDSAILCVEADRELYELSIKSDVPSLAPENKLRITNIRDAQELVSFVRESWGERAFRRIEIIRFSGGWQLFGELYNSLCEALRKEIITNWSNALTLAKLGRLFIRNALRNLPLVDHFPSIAQLSFGDSPVLVLGAGPSLDETLDSVSCHFAQNLAPQSRPFKIICVDTCLGALKDRQIVPDLVVILESQHWNLRDFIGCKGWDVPVAVDLSALPETARLLGGGFIFMTPWTGLRIFERLNEAGLLPTAISPLGSVGLTAVEIARRLTRGKIFFAGLDFSFTVDKYHARGTPGHRSRLYAQTRFRSLINAAAYDAGSFAAVAKDGSSVRTSPIMQNYRALFEQEFGGDSRFFDIEGSGLSLGINTLSIQEALSLLERGRKEEIYHGVTRSDLFAKTSRKGAKTQRRKEFKEEIYHRGERGDEKELTEKVLTFFEGEKARLEALRAILTGEAAADHKRLGVLIDECDYLWAHFPDYSAGRRPSLEEIACGGDKALSFLKRLRAEIDPMLKLVERVYCEEHN